MLLFIWARPTLFSSRAGHMSPRATRASLSRCPTGPACQRHRRPTLLLRPTRQPHPSRSVRPAARARHTSRAPARRFRATTGRAPLTGRQGPPLLVPLPPRVGRVARPPLRFFPSPAPLKRAPRRPSAEFFSPARRLSHPSMPECRTCFPTDPASASSAFLHRRPLPRVGFCRAPPLSFPSPVSAPPSFAIPELELNLSFPFHTGAAGPLHARRRPPEQPRRR
jgi:hypothetical protein